MKIGIIRSDFKESKRPFNEMALLFSDKNEKVKISRYADGYSITTPFLSITALPLTDTNPNDKIMQDVIIPLVSSRISPIIFLMPTGVTKDKIEGV